jgi:hypothetical protein
MNGDEVELVLVWAVLMVALGILAHRRGRSIVVWVGFGLILSPPLAGILLLVLPSSVKKPSKAQRIATLEAEVQRLSGR